MRQGAPEAWKCKFQTPYCGTHSLKQEAPEAAERHMTAAPVSSENPPAAQGEGAICARGGSAPRVRERLARGVEHEAAGAGVVARDAVEQLRQQRREAQHVVRRRALRARAALSAEVLFQQKRVKE